MCVFKKTAGVCRFVEEQSINVQVENLGSSSKSMTSITLYAVSMSSFFDRISPYSSAILLDFKQGRLKRNKTHVALKSTQWVA